VINRIIRHKAFSLFLKIALLSLALYFIYSKLDSLDFSTINLELSSKFWQLTIAFLLLWVINLSMDALSWQRVRKMRESVSWLTALKHNLICMALAFVTPMNSGELIGRYNSMQDKSKYLFLTFWFHLPKFVTKLFFLAVSLVLFALANSNTLLLSTGTAAALALLLIYFNFIKLQRWLRKYQVFNRPLQDYILDDRPRFGEKLELLIINLVRFVVYNLQFILLVILLSKENLDINFLLWVPVFYVLGTFITTIPAFDFIIKSALAVWLFDSSTISEEILLLVPAIVWLFNLALPSLAGVYFIMKTNLNQKLQKVNLTR